MGEAERVSTLIGDIYDASLDPALWCPVLQQIGDFVGGPAAALYSKDTVRKTGDLFHMFGVETEYVQSYFDKYVRFDPFTTSRFFFPVEQVISTKDIMPHEEYRETIFYTSTPRESEDPPCQTARSGFYRTDDMARLSGHRIRGKT